MLVHGIDWLANMWQDLLHPTGLHSWRWRLLSLWVVLLTVTVGAAFKAERDHSRAAIARERSAAAANDMRNCKVARAFISSNVALRNAQNESSVEGIGQRQALIQSDKELLRFVRQSVRSRGREAFMKYLQAEISLSQYQNQSSSRFLFAADKALVRWDRLKRELKC